VTEEEMLMREASYTEICLYNNKKAPNGSFSNTVISLRSKAHYHFFTGSSSDLYIDRSSGEV
jgi:hypothetical protein